MVLPLSGILVRNEPFLAKAGPGVKQKSSFVFCLFFFSINDVLGPK